MSATPNMPNIPGLNRDVTQFKHVSAEEYTFDHIPVLREILPKLRGIPGYYYLQVEVNNRVLAENEMWMEVANLPTYTITGPDGVCNFNLYCTGRRIPGADYRSSKRDCYIDKAILEATGHRNVSALELAVEPTEPEPTEPEPVEEPVAEAVFAPPTPTVPEDEVVLTKAMCGKDGLKGTMGKAAHERRCGKCAAKRAEMGIGEE